MDGASKFVRGDAVAGISIVFINLFGGIIIGAAQHGCRSRRRAAPTRLLTIGDGLVAQIPALLLSVAVAILVTRVSRLARHEPADHVAGAWASRARSAVTGGILTLLGLIPGMPNLVFLGMARPVRRRRVPARQAAHQRKRPPLQLPRRPAKIPAEQRELSWDDVEQIDLIGLEVGYRLIPLVDRKSGRRAHGPNQGRAQEVVRGTRLPRAAGAHPRQPGTRSRTPTGSRS